MSKLWKTLWFLPLGLIAFGCASAPVSDVSTPVESAPAEEAAGTVEKEPEWVTVTVDEYFVSQETIKYADGFIDGYRLYEYSEEGLLLRFSHVASDGSVISEELYTYEGTVLAGSEYIAGGELVSSSVYSYDGKGNLLEERFFDAHGDVQAVSSYEYDNLSRRTKWISGDSGGIPMMYTEYDYDGDVMMRMSYFLPTGELEGYTQLEYDKGVLVGEATYSASGKLEKRTEYVIDGGKIVQVLYYASGKNPVRTIDYVYDADGNVVNETTTGRTGSITDIVEKEYVIFPVTKSVLKQ